MALGTWHLALGTWHLALGTWHIGGLYAQTNCNVNPAGNHWTFGALSGINWENGGAPTTFVSGENTDEGCATVSHYVTGDLLFYTNGYWLIDRNHNPMPFNTASNFLWGHNTSTQSALILKKPGSESIYYVFTAPGYVTEPGNDPQLCNEVAPANGVPTYTIVDMTANGGLGDVKADLISNSLDYSNYSNLPLPIGSSVQVSERLCAAAGPGGGYYWVIYRFRDPLNGPDYLSLKVDSYFPPGGDGTVTSEINTHIIGSCYGQMKVAPCGGELAYAAQYGDGYVEVLSFNRVNGSIANLPSPKVGLIQYATNEQPYGIEFAPNGQVLYVSTAEFVVGGVQSKLYQYDLTQNNIPSTEKLVYEKFTTGSDSGFFAALQIAPNQRIYLANFNSSDLSVIARPNLLLSQSHPNSLNECNYFESNFPLANGTNSYHGLPNMPNNYYSACEACENTDPCLNSDFAFFTTFRKTCVQGTNGQIVFSLINGPTPYEYRIIGPIDSGWQSSGNFTGLPPGMYLLLGRDANGCIITRSLELSCGD